MSDSPLVDYAEKIYEKFGRGNKSEPASKPAPLPDAWNKANEDSRNAQLKAAQKPQAKKATRKRSSGK